MKRQSTSSRNSAQLRRRLQGRPLGFEQVEARNLMAGLQFFGDVLVGPLPMGVAPEPAVMAEGSISYNSATRTLSIEGSQTHGDQVNIYVHRRAGNGAGDLPDLLTVSLANINTPRSFAIDPAAVDKIIFNGYGGNDYLDNRTSIPLQADGGAGNDVLLGGSGDDLLLGGDGNDYLDGRQGNDTLFGQAGVDALFGDEGNDWLYGGSDADYLFGGNGIDYLYGEGGNDKLYGGAAKDVLKGGPGTNKLYSDYGTDSKVSASGFVAFDWFDRYLKDPTVRAQARALYRDGVIDRGDMLKIYTTIATDGVASVIPFNGVVTTNEFSDLKALVSTKLNFQVDTRFFAQRIALGDQANANYQGAPLGNLAANVRGAHLNKLVDKWFKGGDVPLASDGQRIVGYERVEGSLFVNGPSFQDVNQGQVGDCYLMAVLGAVAKHAPSLIVNMFADNGDDTWTVRFFTSGTPVYVTVNRMLPADTYNSYGTAWAAGWGLYAEGGLPRPYYDTENELWVALAEKAYVQLNESGGIGQDGTNRYQGIDAGYVSDAFAHVTGRSATNNYLFYLIFPPSSSDITKAQKAGHAIVLSSKSEPDNELITKSHAYIVTGYNATTQLFQLYNVHGFYNKDAADGGYQSPVIEANWSAILANFDVWTSLLI